MPDTIKALLVDDWENVTKNLTLAPLPHPHPVSELLRSYLAEEQSRRKSSSIEYDRVEEVTAGVKEYFDKCLGVMLLYKFERQQYKDILAKTIDSGDVQWEGKTISDVYGAEHLCRLFGILFLIFALRYAHADACISVLSRTYRADKHGPTICFSSS